MKRISIVMVMAALVLVFAAAHAQEGTKPGGEKEGAKPKGPPPSVVVTEVLKAGEAEPMAEFVGTVYYARTSKLATEVEGKVRRVLYSEGQRVKKGQRLVLLSTDILQKTVQATRSSFEQASQELEKAQKDFERIAPLYKEGAVAEALYDEHRYRVGALQSKAKGLESELNRLELQLEKKTIRTPYSGVVLDRPVEEGEWVPPGGVVAVLADDADVDIVVDVPESSLPFLERGRRFDITARGQTFKGELISVVPRGDLATRTFAVKLRMRNVAGLLEGMEARAMLPTGPKAEGLLINRDAVVNVFGMQAIYIVAEGAAKMVPVQVMGYAGIKASVAGPGLEDGMMVVVKGNERLGQGGPVMVKGAGEGPKEAAPRGPEPNAGGR